MKGQVYLYDENNKEVKGLPINHVEFKRELIVEKSINKFNDNDPCIIHETWCRNELALELSKKLQEEHKSIVGKVVEVTELPEEIINKINITKNIKRIKFV